MRSYGLFGRRLGMLLAAGGAGGLLVAGVGLPLFGGLGLAARAGIAHWDGLPAALNVPPLPQVSRIVSADGHTLATFYYEDRIPTSLAQIPSAMQNAIIAIEDSRFYQHHGVDFRGLLRAALRNGEAGAVRQGGSTLTQQYVKNLLIESASTPAERAAAAADTLSRKIQEARYALALEQRMSKSQILEGYLNIAYFGDGAYGVGAAALHYFDEPADRLSLAQSALLAGIVEDPTAYDPALHPVHARARRDVVLARMQQLGYITTAQRRSAEATPVVLHLTETSNGCESSTAPFFCDYVLDDVEQNPVFGPNATARLQLLLRGGLTIVTSLEPKTQQAAQRAVDGQVGRSSRFAATVAVVQPGTGRVMAMAINRGFGVRSGETEVNYAADASYGGSSGFQAGSTFKVFVLIAALRMGIPLGLTINSPPVLEPTAHYTNCAGQALSYGRPVHNAETAEGGRFNLLTGTWQSVNTFYVQLEQRTGLCQPAQIAAAMGVSQADGQPLQQVPSFTLGTNEVSPLDMAEAYATLAAQGRYCPPVAIVAVVDRSGHELPLPPSGCRQVLDPTLAETVTAVLRGVIDGPDAARTGSGASIGRPAAGKTGTVENYASAWFAGYTPDLAAAVALVDPAGPQRDPLQDVTIAGTYYSAVFGGSIPASIWRLTMLGALAGVPVHNFTPPHGRFAVGLTVSVPNVSGLSPTVAVATLNAAGLSATVVPGEVSASTLAGTIAYTSPAAGAQVPIGSSVNVFVSNGVPPPVPKPSPSRSPRPTPSPHPRHRRLPPGSPPPTPSRPPSG